MSNHNRYWTGPQGLKDPKNCHHGSMVFTVAVPSVSLRCLDCGTQATLRMDEAQSFSTDRAQSALNQARDASLPLLDVQEWEKIWREHP